MSQIIENIRWVLKDIGDWVDNAKFLLNANTNILLKLLEVKDSDREEVFSAAHDAGIDRYRNFQELAEELIKIRGTHLQKYDDYYKLLKIFNYQRR